MKAGYIDYINCYPFYHTIFYNNAFPRLEVTAAHPAQLNDMMRDAKLDAGPVSAAAYADLQDTVFLFPEFCLSSAGYVRSVILMSRCPVEELSGKTVSLSRASETSVVLLKILLKKYFSVECEYVPGSETGLPDDADAALVIGNDALVALKKPVEYVYDIGDLWMRKTGHPVVFALFAVQKTFYEKKPDDVCRLTACYRQSLDLLHTDRPFIVQSARLRYPQVDFDIEEYYALLKFEFTRQMKDAVLFYFSQAAAAGLLKPVDRLICIPEASDE